ncbi:hypothetical protein C0J52_10391 [Blattella germanica]|nr:hypothetical protein C0J52_10391 [Blattella germanica]
MLVALHLENTLMLKLVQQAVNLIVPFTMYLLIAIQIMELLFRVKIYNYLNPVQAQIQQVAIQSLLQEQESLHRITH